jgi:hypothetical protein
LLQRGGSVLLEEEEEEEWSDDRRGRFRGFIVARSYGDFFLAFAATAAPELLGKLTTGDLEECSDASGDGRWIVAISERCGSLLSCLQDLEIHHQRPREDSGRVRKAHIPHIPQTGM